MHQSLSKPSANAIYSLKNTTPKDDQCVMKSPAIKVQPLGPTYKLGKTDKIDRLIMSSEINISTNHLAYMYI